MISKNLIYTFRRFVSSRRFFVGILIFFVLQGIFFSLVVDRTAAPDESFHLPFIQYYAHLPLLHGPIIHHQQADTLELGDIERIPSYLYHYLMSFPYRGLEAMGLPTAGLYLAMRLFDVLISVASLWLFRRILLRVGSSAMVANLSTLALSVTGSFVYVSASVNYDLLGIFCFFGTIYFALGVLQRTDVQSLIWTGFFAMASSLIKYTFMPFVGLVFLLVLGIYIAHWKPFNQVVHMLRTNWKRHRFKLLGVLLVIVVTFLLFAERYGGNMVAYHTVSPSCAKVHGQQACTVYWAQKRAEAQAIEYRAAVASGNGLIYEGRWVGEWVEYMYRSLYAYANHRMAKSPGPVYRAFGYVALAIVIIVFLLKRQELLTSRSLQFLAGVTITYVLGVHLFNFNTLIFKGAPFAWNGKYLLPAIGFVYFLVFLQIIKYWHSMKSQIKYPLAAALILFCLALLVLYLPITSWWLYTDKSWYTDSAQQLIPAWFYNNYIYL